MIGSLKFGQIIAGTLLCAAVVAASRVPWQPAPDGPAVVRLSWRAVLPSVEDCHAPTDAELTGLPAHMRPAEICNGRPIPFRLRFVFDGEVLVDERVVGAGIREDRPMYVFHELQTEPGVHRIEVDFGPDNADAGTLGEVQGYVLREEVQLGPLDIALVTREADGTLVVR